jgi:Raf kinase inhibitor-like YbhB/YbcL family protein
VTARARGLALAFALAFALVAMSAAISESLAAQTPAPPAAPQGRAGGGGRGRGRGPIAVMTLTTSAFADGARIPDKYAQPGHDLSPALAWIGAPDSTASYVLIVHDLDAAIGNGTDDLLQWMVWNIPASAHSLAEGIPQGGQLADGSRQISGTGPYYRGPNAPVTGPVHHVAFELYALDVVLDVPAVGAAPPASRAAVIAAMATHIRGKAVLVGSYRRTP